MAKDPKIPMVPEDRPQQRLNLVVDLPPRPDVAFVVGYDVFPEEEMRRRPWPRSPHLLANVEWAETPMNNGINAYYIAGKRRFWMLWNRWFDDNSWTPRWEWSSAGYCPRKGIDLHTAAIYLLMDYFAMEGTAYEEDSDHWINETGLLSVEELRAIARSIRENGRSATAGSR